MKRLIAKGRFRTRVGKSPSSAPALELTSGLHLFLISDDFVDNILKLMALEYRKGYDGSKAEFVQMDLRAYF